MHAYSSLVHVDKGAIISITCAGVKGPAPHTCGEAWNISENTLCIRSVPTIAYMHAVD